MDLAAAQQTIADMDSGKTIWDDNVRAQANNIIGGSNPSLPNLDLSGLPSSLEFAKSLTGMENKAFDDFLKVQQGQENPLALYQRLEGQSDIPTLKNTASSLQKQIQSVEDTIALAENSIRNRSQNSLVTEDQIRNMINETRRPLNEQLERLGTASGRVGNALALAREGLNTQANLAMAGQDRELEPYKMRINMVSDQAARMMTGFTSDKQTALDGIIAKFNAGVQLSMEEIRSANDLAKMAKQYELERDNFMFEMESNGGANDFVDLGTKIGLIDPKTGQVISTYNKGYRAASGGSDGW